MNLHADAMSLYIKDVVADFRRQNNEAPQDLAVLLSFIQDLSRRFSEEIRSALETPSNPYQEFLDIFQSGDYVHIPQYFTLGVLIEFNPDLCDSVHQDAIRYFIACLQKIDLYCAHDERGTRDVMLEALGREINQQMRRELRNYVHAYAQEWEHRCPGTLKALGLTVSDDSEEEGYENDYMMH